MKKLILTAALALTVAGSAFAEKQTVKLYIPEMECNNCKGKVENVLAFEKGVRKFVEFNVEERTVTLIYEGTKTNVANLQAALMKHLKYDSKEIKDGETAIGADKKPACSSTCTGHGHTHKH